jgi:hypothetical protein
MGLADRVPPMMSATVLVFIAMRRKVSLEAQGTTDPFAAKSPFTR